MFLYSTQPRCLWGRPSLILGALEGASLFLCLPNTQAAGGTRTHTQAKALLFVHTTSRAHGTNAGAAFLAAQGLKKYRPHTLSTGGVLCNSILCRFCAALCLAMKIGDSNQCQASLASCFHIPPCISFPRFIFVHFGGGQKSFFCAGATTKPVSQLSERARKC